MQIFSKELLLAADDLHGIKEWTTYGTYSFKLSRRTRVKLTIVGSGQDSSKWVMMGTTYYAGYGGGYFVGQAYLPSGAYTVVIHHSETGSPDSSGSTTPSSNAVVLLSASTGALITVANGITKHSNFDYIPGTIEHEEQGNGEYGSSTGGASLYMGYGKGSDAKKHNNTSGYFKIEW